MPEIKIHIKNLAEIQAAFAKSPSVMARNLHMGINRSLILVERQSRINVSGRMVNVQSNRLRSSHYVRFQSKLSGEVGTNVYYDKFVHNGTRFMRARPYIQAAVDTSQSAIDREFTGAVQDTLDHIARSAS